jgi:signal transduction histidine kinase
MSNSNLIRLSADEKLRQFLQRIQTSDPVQGKRLAISLYKKIADCISTSFEADIAPTKLTPTRAVLDDRLDKCVELCLALAEDGWVVSRIVDELPSLFKKKMRTEHIEINKRNSWGVQEDIEVEHDFSEVHQ